MPKSNDIVKGYVPQGEEQGAAARPAREVTEVADMEGKATFVGKPPEAPPVSTFTNWEAFKKAQVAVEWIVCQGYRPSQMVDVACHTRLKMDPQQWADHVTADHGGGFRVKLRIADKPSPIWDKIAATGLESRDFRCETCDAIVPFHPSHILKHMKSHSGKTRRVKDLKEFNITLSLGFAEPSDSDTLDDLG